MNESKIKLVDRSKLYEQAWSIPMTKLAKEYGMSDNGLRKVCERLKVPIPKVGYWQKIQYGKTAKREPLPDFEGKQDVEIKPTVKPEENAKINNQPPEIVAEFLLQNKINVVEVLDKPHPLIQSLKKNLNRKEKYLHKGMISGQRGELHVSASPESVDRALRIMDALIKALEKRGRRVFVDTKDEYKTPTCVQWEDERLQISLYEKHRVVKKEVKKNSWDGDYDYIPSGVLVLRIGDDYWNERNHWKDGKKKKLEDQLNDFIVGLYDEYKARKDRKLYWEQRKLEEQEKYRQLEELQKKKEIEQKKIQKLEEDALNWHKSQIIRSYIKESERVYIDKNREVLSGSDFENWLIWAKNHAQFLDPLQKNVQVEKVE